jgi:hypothetical protein
MDQLILHELPAQIALPIIWGVVICAAFLTAVRKRK